MYIESSIHEKHIRTIELGCFPKRVLSFQDSQQFLEQLVFIDYQLLLLVQNEFGGHDLVPALALDHSETPRDKLVQLINYANSVSANYSDALKSPEEALYHGVIMAHIFYLNSQFDHMHHALDTCMPLRVDRDTTHADFIRYLNCRHTVLMGLVAGPGVWEQYLREFKPLSKSAVAAKRWLELLFAKLAGSWGTGGLDLIAFSDFKAHDLIENKSALIAMSCFLLRPENTQLANRSFKTEFLNYLAEELESAIKTPADFPDAAATDSSDNFLLDFIDNLYLSLGQVPLSYSVLKPTLTKKFLINAMLKTFQSHGVTANLIKCLIQLNEHDEALAAFKTYVSYIENTQRQNDGRIDDILSIIDIYSTCLLQFNPLKAIVPHKPRKFKYTTDDSIVQQLQHHSVLLAKYLDIVARDADLSYHLGDADDIDANPISFLYNKYNVNVLLDDHSQFVEIVSKGWYALGYLSYFLATHASADQSALDVHVELTLRAYKNALIVNSTGNVIYLFNYALALAFARKLKPALKLCKFILKKYPESFKTWNLMVLLLTSFESSNPDAAPLVTVPNASNVGLAPLPTNPRGNANGSESINGANSANGSTTLKDLEKFINNALNIAGLFIVKHRQKDIKLTSEAKYEILQLKLTQMAVWEAVYGVQYILEYVSEVFILYHELFAVELEPMRPEPAKQSVLLASDAKWSHRPSFIDPLPDSDAVVLENGALATKDNQESIDRIKRMAKSSKKDRLGSLKRIGLQRRHSQRVPVAPKPTAQATLPSSHIIERKILQDIWLWTSSIYMKLGLLEESEQCIVEAETVYEPNVKTFTALGSLTSASRKFLSLQEFERSLEILNKEPYNKADYGHALLGLSKLLLVDDASDSSLFILDKDREAGIVRMKNLLEKYVLSWPFGHSSLESWYFLSKVYETIDDKDLLASALWRCVELEDYRPVRTFECCDSFYYKY